MPSSFKDLIVRILGDGSNFRRDIEEDKVALDEAIDEMNRKKADPKVKLHGVDLVNALLTEINAKMDDLNGKTATVNVKEKRTGNLGEGGGGALAGLIMTSLPLLSSVGAPALGGLMGLASAFTAATVGVAGFGAVAVPVLKSVFDASSKLTAAQQAYNKATTDKQKQAALQQEKQAMAGLSQEQVKAVNSLRTFESFWSNFTKSFQNPVLNLFTNGLNAVKTILIDIKPAIQGAASGFNVLMNDFNNALKQWDVQNFFSAVNSTAKRFVVSFGKSFGDVIRGMINLMTLFMPLGDTMAGGVQHLAESFLKWSQGLQNNPGVVNFFNYVLKTGPLLMQTLGNLAKSIINILIAMAPLGTGLLTVVDALSKFIKWLTQAHPVLTELIMAAIQGIGVFKLLGLVLAGLGGPWGILIAAIITGTTLIIGHWSQINNWAKDHFGSSIPQIMHGLLNVFKSVWNGIVKVVKEAWNYMKPTIVGGLQTVEKYWKSIWPELSQVLKFAFNVMKLYVEAYAAFFRGAWPSLWNAAKQILKTVWDAITGIIKLSWDIISGIIKVGLDVLTGHWGRAWNDMKSTTSRVWGDIKSIFSHVGSDMLKVGEDIVSGIWNGISGMGTWITSKITSWVSDHIPGPIKKALNINSPSRVMRDEVGKWIPMGIAEGIDAYGHVIKQSMNNLSVGIMGHNFVVSSNVARMVSGGTGYGFGGQIQHQTVQYNQPLLRVENMTVRNDQDIRQLSKQLYQYQQMQDRFKG